MGPMGGRGRERRENENGNPTINKHPILIIQNSRSCCGDSPPVFQPIPIPTRDPPVPTALCHPPPSPPPLTSSSTLSYPFHPSDPFHPLSSSQTPISMHLDAAIPEIDRFRSTSRVGSTAISALRFSTTHASFPPPTPPCTPLPLL